MQLVFAAAQVLQRDAVLDGVTVAPVLVAPFKPVHELQAFALVIVACGKLDGDGILVVLELYAARLVQSLRQYNIAVVDMTNLDFLFAYIELGKHDSRKRLGILANVVACPVYAIEPTKEHIAVIFYQNGTRIELIAEQTVRHIVVIKAVTNGTVV